MQILINILLVLVVARMEPDGFLHMVFFFLLQATNRILIIVSYVHISTDTEEKGSMIVILYNLHTIITHPNSEN